MKTVRWLGEREGDGVLVIGEYNLAEGPLVLAHGNYEFRTEEPMHVRVTPTAEGVVLTLEDDEGGQR